MLQELKSAFEVWRMGLGEWHAKEMIARLIAIIEGQEAALQALAAQIEDLRAALPAPKDKK